ncbi:MAG: Flp family type IVb pilin, partial [Stellaceae bacterium]
TLQQRRHLGLTVEQKALLRSSFGGVLGLADDRLGALARQPSALGITLSVSPQENRMRSTVARLFSAEAGVTAVEYGLLIGLIAIVMIAALSALGTAISTTLSTIATSL